MKKQSLTISVTAACTALLFILLGLTACNKEDDTYEPSGPGNVLFYFNENCGGGAVVITLDGRSRTLSKYITSGTPSCGSEGTATFADMAPGTYAYSGTSSSKTWSGSVTISSGVCRPVLLTCSGGSSGGGGGTGGGGTGAGTSLPGYGGTSSGGYWKRSDGTNTYVSISGAIAKTCNSGTLTTGTFKTSKPYSMTFQIGGSNLTFPLDFSTDGKQMIVGVPDQAWSTHTAMAYNKSSTFPCSGSGGGGGGTVTQGTAIIWTNLKSTGYSYNVGVNVKGYVQMRYITANHSSAPACGTTNAANYTLDPGTYSYTVTGKKWHASGTPTDATWGRSFTIVSGQCVSREVK